MNKLFTISSIVLSGLLLGSLAGKTSTLENNLKVKRSNLNKNSNSLKRHLTKSRNDDEMDQYFI